MAQPHVIELALDLARMPALARRSGASALPPNIIELMRIAAASPEACGAAMAQTGEPRHVLIEAARFYLQQVLFRPDADCYRILGIEPTDSRETARSHMRWLLEWLHPDRNNNNNSWDTVYAERVLKAWREVSGASGSAAKTAFALARVSSNMKRKKRNQARRLPWIERPVHGRSLAMRNPYRTFVLWALSTGLVIIFLALWSANAFLQP
jgi:hypothetical protein